MKHDFNTSSSGRLLPRQFVIACTNAYIFMGMMTACAYYISYAIDNAKPSAPAITQRVIEGMDNARRNPVIRQPDRHYTAFRG